MNSRTAISMHCLTRLLFLICITSAVFAHADGSWLAESVKFKAQPYFENGDPLA